jgi:hypothetical protein
LGGCTIVQIEGDSKVSRPYFGILRIEPSPTADVVTVNSNGLGVIPSNQGATLGWRSEQMVIVRDASVCSLIVLRWPSDPILAQRLMEIAAMENAICFQGDMK